MDAFTSLFHSRSYQSVGELPKNWAIAKDDRGDTYYWNKVTQETTYELPEALPGKWKDAFDKKSGSPYYYHSRTQEVRWEKPTHDECEYDRARASSITQAPDPPPLQQTLLRPS